jgi:dCMP deaminase
MRPSWSDYFLGIAEAVSKRGDCTRRQVGAVIVDQDHRIIAAGYNGAPPGDRGCLSDGACPRGQHTELYGWHPVHGSGTLLGCRCGGSWPCEQAVEPGSSYDTGTGACIAIHAEANALLYAFRSVAGADMYITERPCDGCLKLIRGAQIRFVVTPSGSLA